MGLGTAAEALDDLVSDACESLLAFGELIEMRLEGDSPEGPFVIRPAPPHFVRRADGSYLILGVAGEELTPLAEGLAPRISNRAVLRQVRSTDAEDLKAYLQDLGVEELPEGVWLRMPKQESPADCLRGWLLKLRERPRSGHIEGLRVIDHSSRPDFYKGRWVEPRQHSGPHVGRRPQKYGPDLWCLVEVENGSATRFLDLASAGDRFRPSDIAWRIQMAFDARRGEPQSFEVRGGDGNCSIAFFSPLPSWAERKLLAAGEKAPEPRCLFAYQVQPSEVAELKVFLEDRLWLACRNS
jgi:hypothetical protein